MNGRTRDVLNEAKRTLCRWQTRLPSSASVEVESVILDIDTAIAEPVRNCDRFRDVDEAYNQFMNYVKRENPSFTKPSPLHTAWDALKWVLDGEKKKEDGQ
jgi:hypothetical protein